MRWRAPRWLRWWLDWSAGAFEWVAGHRLALLLMVSIEVTVIAVLAKVGG